MHNAFHGRDKPWDPYGVAKVDLSELLLGNRFLYLKVPVHTCKSPDVLGLTGTSGGRLVGIPGAVDGPGEIFLLTMVLSRHGLNMTLGYQVS